MRKIKRSDIFRDVAETKAFDPVDIGNINDPAFENTDYNEKRKVQRRLKRDAAFSKARSRVDFIAEEKAFRLEREFDV